MSKIDDDSSEDDIWTYKGVKKRKSNDGVSDKLVRTQCSSRNIAQSQTAPPSRTAGSASAKRGQVLSSSQNVSNSKSNKQSHKGKQTVTRARTKNTGSANPHFSSTQPIGKNPLKLSQKVSLTQSSMSKSKAKRTPLKKHDSKCTFCCEDKDVKPTRQKHSGFCPFCQLPFSVLTVETPQWHVSECQDFSFDRLPECPKKWQCDNTIASHFRRFKHTELAKRRDGNQDIANQQGGLEKPDPEKTVQRHEPKENPSEPESRHHPPPKIEPSSIPTTSNSKVAELVHPPEEQQAPSKDEHSAFAQHLQDLHRTRRSLFSEDSPSLTDDDEVRTFHIVNKIQVDSQCWSDTQESTSDIFAGEDETLEDHQRLDGNKELSEMLADALESERGNSEDDDELKIRNHQPEPCSDTNDSAESVICTGTSSTKENSFNLTPLSPALTPLSPDVQSKGFSTPAKSPANAKAQADFLKLLTSSSSAKKSSAKTPRKRALLNSAQKSASKTPSSAKKSRTVGKNVTSAKKTLIVKKEEVDKKPSLPCPQNGTGSARKQASMLSFFGMKSEKTQTKDVKSITSSTQDANKTGPKQNAENRNKHDVGSTDKIDADSNQQPSPSMAGTSASTGRKWWLKAPATSVSNKPGPSSSEPESDSSSGAATSSSNNTVNKGPRLRYGTKTNTNRQCPFYKKIPDTHFTVDAFRYGSIPGCSAYFLSHFHYDHYMGLTRHFSHPIYCSQVTANLVQAKVKVNAKYMRPLTLNQTHVVDGVEVVLLEANHCPGSVLLLFRPPEGKVTLHTGDFRACTAMEEYPQLAGVSVDHLYLDTTYCDPNHAFPPQNDVIQFAVNIATDFMQRHPKGLVAVGSYTIGKERIFQAVAAALSSRVCVTKEKLAILRCLDDAHLARALTLDGHSATVHVVPMKALNFKDLTTYLEKFRGRYDCVLGLEPTGWTHSKKTVSLEDIKPKLVLHGVTLYGVPYSEHSSYTEMKRFVQFLRPDKIIPTVNNGNPANRNKMDRLFSDWLRETSESKAKKQAGIGQWAVKSSAT